MSKKPTHTAYTVREGKDGAKPYWQAIGSVWTNTNGSFKVRLNALPIDGGKAKEDGKVGGVANISAGVSRKLVLDLPAGHYVLICNVPGHYQLGMRTALTVE